MSLSFLSEAIRSLSFSGCFVSVSKNSLGVMPRYTQINKKPDIEGRALTFSILFMHPAFCPIERLILLADTPF